MLIVLPGICGRCLLARPRGVVRSAAGRRPTRTCGKAHSYLGEPNQGRIRGATCDRTPEPLWLWSSRAGTSAGQVDRAWQAFLRRFDIEHTFRFLKQVLGWTRPKLRDPAAADRWTWLILTCYAQLYLARHLAADIRLPWQQPCPPGRLTPARVRRGFRNIRQALPDLASAPKPGKPGPGGQPGSKNRRPATRHDVGKTVTRDQPKKKTRRQKG